MRATMRPIWRAAAAMMAAGRALGVCLLQLPRYSYPGTIRLSE